MPKFIHLANSSLFRLLQLFVAEHIKSTFKGFRLKTAVCANNKKLNIVFNLSLTTVYTELGSAIKLENGDRSCWLRWFSASSQIADMFGLNLCYFWPSWLSYGALCGPDVDQLSVVGLIVGQKWSQYEKSSYGNFLVGYIPWSNSASQCQMWAKHFAIWDCY